MSSTTTANLQPTQAPPLEKKTTVGNYFVANYPPFSFWTPEHVEDVYRAINRPPAPDVPLGIYMHIPFCRKRCHFCYFKVYTDKDAAAIRAYVDATLDELKLYSNKPFVGGRSANFVYFGGGTPSYLSVKQLRHLVDGMKAEIPWDGVEEVTFECEPGTLNETKLKALREMGVTRLSLGVENFSEHVLEINGRAHRGKEIHRAYNYAREVGFPQINIDLIAGMIEETDENWQDCIRKTIELEPDSVTIYQMEIPYNTTIFKQMKSEGKIAAPVADWDKKRAWVSQAFDELKKAGYTVGSAYTAVKDPEKTKFLYRDKLWAGADLLALGVASFGHLGGTHYQNHQDFDPYVKAVQAGEYPIFRAMTPNDEERLIRELVLQLKLGHVSRAYFQEKFGVDIAERFAEPIQRLKDWGFMSVDGDTVAVNREGLLQVDRLLHEFFLPKHWNVRYT